MSKNLVIVESPAKAKTIGKYLGKDFDVMASYGHVRDLVPKEGAVDPEQGFAMKYQIIERNEKHVKSIIRALKKADALYLATDPDREGEAISWHLVELLREKKALNGKPVHRVIFHEITRDAVREAIDSPREISSELVSAQQARRALDYLVGFNLSPLLWKKVQRGLSAGRVQSPALRMIVERELEIEAFKPREYWTIEADVSKKEQPFVARLVRYRGDKVEQFSFGDETAAREVEKTLLEASAGKLTAVSVEKKQRRRNPAAPFTTSTLQQEASRKLGFNTQWTMRVAQRLYEGIELPDEGNVGLITYMRTDSVTLAEVAVAEIRDVIRERYGDKNVPDEIRTFKTKAKNAQEAHEAIRPTSVTRTPESLKGKLDEEQLKLYTLIWRRTMACQMVPAIFDTVALEFTPGKTTVDAADDQHRLRANGSVLVEPGFMAVYHEGRDDSKDDDGDRLLPEVSEGDVISPRRAAPRAAFHRAAAPFHGSEPGQDARGIRHRPAIDLCLHYCHAEEPRVCRDGRQTLHPDRHRQDRQRLPDRAFHPVCRLRLYGAPRGRPGCSLSRREGPRAVAGTFLEAVPRPGRGQGTERHA